jgi:hypothetical protein
MSTVADIFAGKLAGEIRLYLGASSEIDFFE